MATEATLSPTPALTSTQAAAAIAELINARPTGPRQDEIEAIIARAVVPTTAALSGNQAALVAAVRECVAAQKATALGPVPCPEKEEAAIERYSRALDRVGELAQKLPTPARSITDVILRAQVAYAYAADDGLEPRDEVEKTAHRLIEAVHQFAGIRYE
jgi:hypothetical protein